MVAFQSLIQMVTKFYWISMSKISTFLSIVCLLISCEQQSSSRVNILEGSWKMEGQEQYEVWERDPANELRGSSYLLKDSQRIPLETLTIKFLGQDTVLEATVPNQNEGRTIAFTLNSEIGDRLSFENPAHDFPQKIQYRPISVNEMEVIVTGAGDRGFSYRQKKSDPR